MHNSRKAIFRYELIKVSKREKNSKEREGEKERVRDRKVEGEISKERKKEKYTE